MVRNVVAWVITPLRVSVTDVAVQGRVDRKSEAPPTPGRGPAWMRPERSQRDCRHWRTGRRSPDPLTGNPTRAPSRRRHARCSATRSSTREAARRAIVVDRVSPSWSRYDCVTGRNLDGCQVRLNSSWTGHAPALDSPRCAATMRALIGSSMTKQAPRVDRSARIRPPCASMMRRLIERPRPVPGTATSPFRPR